jgi:hypothetical protein
LSTHLRLGLPSGLLPSGKVTTAVTNSNSCSRLSRGLHQWCLDVWLYFHLLSCHSVCGACIASLRTAWCAHSEHCLHIRSSRRDWQTVWKSRQNYNKLYLLINISVESPSHYSDRITKNAITATPRPT